MTNSVFRQGKTYIANVKISLMEISEDNSFKTSSDFIPINRGTRFTYSDFQTLKLVKDYTLL